MSIQLTWLLMNFFFKESLDGAGYVWGRNAIKDSENLTNASSQIKSIGDGRLCIITAYTSQIKTIRLECSVMQISVILSTKDYWMNKGIWTRVLQITTVQMQDYFNVT